MRKAKGLTMIALLLSGVLALSACAYPEITPDPDLTETDPGQQTPTTTGLDRSAQTYTQLLDKIRKQIETSSTAGNQKMFGTRETAAAAISADAGALADNSGLQEISADYSTTNIQVEGVDEADIIKTDGQYLYVIANNRLYIIRALQPDQLAVTAQVDLSAYTETDLISTGEYPVELFLDTDHQRLILMVNGYLYDKQPAVNPETVTDETSTSGESKSELAKIAGDLYYPYYSNKQYTSTRIYDIQDKAAPVLVRQFSQEGSYVSSRKIGSNLYVVTNQYQNMIYGMSGLAVRDTVGAESTGDENDPAAYFPATNSGEVTGSWDTIPADRIGLVPDGDPGAQLVLSAIDTVNDSAEPDVLSIIGSSGTIYASNNYLYVAGYRYIWHEPENLPHATTTPDMTIEPAIKATTGIAIEPDTTVATGIAIEPDTTVATDTAIEPAMDYYGYSENFTDLYRFRLGNGTIEEAGTGTVPGTILNQYSMDESDGYFRLATTSGEVWRNDAYTSQNNLYILDEALNITGKIEGLAGGEVIKSVRFMGNQAYVVTFRTTDPLFVLDLADPTAPSVLGELKIPGYSSYLHPISNNRLLGFGYEVTVNGDIAYENGLKVSLFDISDLSQPKEISTVVLGSRGSYSELVYNAKSLVFSESKNLIAFPASLAMTAAGQGNDYGWPYFQGLVVMNLMDGQLQLRGGISHTDQLGQIFADQTVSGLEHYSDQAYGSAAITRGAYIGDVLYTFSSRWIMASHMSDLTTLGQVELPGYDSQENTVYYTD